MDVISKSASGTNGSKKAPPPPLPMGALESAELSADELRIAVMRARAAEVNAAHGSFDDVDVVTDPGQLLSSNLVSPNLSPNLAPSTPSLPASPSTTIKAKKKRASKVRAPRSREGAAETSGAMLVSSKKRRGSTVRVQVNEQGKLAAGQSPIAGILTDVSLSGAFLASDRTLAPGSEVTLRFSLPLGEDGGLGKVEVRAEVRHRGQMQSGVGLRFLRMPADAMATIQRFLDENRDDG